MNRLFKIGLRRKVFILCIVLELVTLAAFSVVGFTLIREISASSEETGRQEKETVAATSAQSMEALVSSYFISYAIAQSDISDNSFWNMADSVYMLALQVQQIMISPEDYARRSVLPPTAENAGEPSAQLLFSDVAAASDASLLEKTERLGNLQDQMVAVISTSSGMKDCFIALPDGACILCDASAEEHVDENGAPVYFDATQRPWYRMAVNHEMLTFSSVSSDYYTGTYEVNVAVPVYNRFGKLMAVCGASMSLDNIEALVENAHVGDNGFSCIVNDSGKILFSNRQEGTLGLSNKTDLRDNENSELSTLITDALSGNVDFKMITVDDEELCITYAPLASVGWTQLMVIPKDELDAPTERLLEQLDVVAESSQERFQKTLHRTMMTLIFLLVVMLILAVILSLLFSDRLVRPIDRMTKRVHSISGEDMLFEMEDAYRTGDEIEILAKSFSDMSEKTIRYIDEITVITAEKQKVMTEMSNARNIQESAVPCIFPPFPDNEAFGLYASMDTAEAVGGDFYDFFMADENTLAVVMADVSGKGMPAALYMMRAKTLIKTYAEQGLPVEEVAIQTNLRLCEDVSAEMFVTAWLGFLDLTTGVLSYVHAGHTLPVLISEEVSFVKQKINTVLGGLKRVKYVRQEITLSHGDSIFLYTDGVTEAHDINGDMYGDDRLLELIRAKVGDITASDRHEYCKKACEMVLSDVKDFEKGAEQFDDITMMWLKYI